MISGPLTSGTAFDAMRRVTAPHLERHLLKLPVPYPVQRQVFEASVPLLRPAPDMATEWREVAGIRVRVARPEGARGRAIWLHGGGFVMGSPASYAGLTDRVARVAGVEMWVPEYRLAPEHPYPAAPDDCLAVARAIEGPFHLGGDSAGGTLALAILQDLLPETAPLSVTLVSPGVDLRPDRPPHDHSEMVFSEDVLRGFQAAYVGGGDPTDPRISPLYGEYAGTPPTLIDLSEGEFLEAEGHDLAARMRAAGVDVMVHVESGVPHDYHLFAGRSAAADRALARIARHMAAA